MLAAELPPGRYFVSHSYADRAAVEALLAELPSSVSTHVFEPLDCSPLEFVSSTLVGSILTCDGLIYIQRRNSNLSFWVAFEREYALRAGKPVFEYGYARRRIERLARKPIELKLFFCAAVEDYPKLYLLMDFMKAKRHFEFILPHDEMARNASEGMHSLFNVRQENIDGLLHSLLDSWTGEVVESVFKQAIFNDQAEGNIVVFWSRHSLLSPFQQDDLAIAERVLGGFVERVWHQERDQVEGAFWRMLNAKVLFVRLDDTPLPPWVRDPVQLFGDSERSEINRMDDLIVTLYHRFVSAVDFRGQAKL